MQLVHFCANHGLRLFSCLFYRNTWVIMILKLEMIETHPTWLLKINIINDIVCDIVWTYIQREKKIESLQRAVKTVKKIVFDLDNLLNVVYSHILNTITTTLIATFHTVLDKTSAADVIFSTYISPKVAVLFRGIRILIEKLLIDVLWLFSVIFVAFDLGRFIAEIDFRKHEVYITFWFFLLFRNSNDRLKWRWTASRHFVPECWILLNCWVYSMIKIEDSVP